METFKPPDASIEPGTLALFADVGLGVGLVVGIGLGMGMDGLALVASEHGVAGGQVVRLRTRFVPARAGGLVAG